MTDEERNRDLTAEQVAAYELFDLCAKPCTQFCHGRNAMQVAEAIVEAGLTERCLGGIDGIDCPYKTERGPVFEALKALKSQKP